jgi:hypothetical protein
VIFRPRVRGEQAVEHRERARELVSLATQRTGQLDQGLELLRDRLGVAREGAVQARLLGVAPEGVGDAPDQPQRLACQAGAPLERQRGTLGASLGEVRGSVHAEE